MFVLKLFGVQCFVRRRFADLVLFHVLFAGVCCFVQCFVQCLAVCSASARSFAAFEELHPKAKVKIHGLQNAAHLNGQRATLESFIDSSQRWRVQLEDGEKKDVKSQNLKLQDLIHPFALLDILFDVLFGFKVMLCLFRNGRFLW